MPTSSPYRLLEILSRRFRGGAGRASGRPRTRRNRLVPRPEALESRTVLSGGYSFSTINGPGAGTIGSSYGVQGTFSIGINNRGEISGNYGDAAYVTHGFLLRHGPYTTLDDPNAGTVANPAGASSRAPIRPRSTTGARSSASTSTPATSSTACCSSNGHFTTIDPPGAANQPGPSFTTNIDQAAAINNFGEIVGGYTDRKALPTDTC